MAHPNPRLVTSAASRLKSHVIRTPLLEAPLFNEFVQDTLKLKGARVKVKAENLQHTGAFKFRGATNKLLQLSDFQKSQGVVAFSSGNFAQALALASRNVGVKCTIVSPHDAPPLKLERTRRYGADVILSTPENGENREICASAMAEKFAKDHGATLLHPFDDWDVIYGQGTLALEMFEQTDAKLAALVVPTGGGGMLAGSALASLLVSPSTKLFAVEPSGYDDHCQSFYSKARTPLDPTVIPQETISDALCASAPGHLTWQVNGEALTGASHISDEKAIEAMKIAFTEFKLVLEPSGALGLAALLNGDLDGHIQPGDCVGVVACGGNVSLGDYVKFVT